MTKAQAAKLGRPRKLSRNLFAVWLDGCGKTVEKVAEELDVKLATVYGWRAGRYKPGRENSAAIERVSRGAVPMSSWDRKRARQ